MSRHPFTSNDARSRAIIESRTELDLSGIERLVSSPADQRRLGPFVLARRLGRGSFAPVWLAQEVYGATALRQVALKLFVLPRADTPREKSRALDAIVAEAGALCKVEHPNVVRFYALPIDEAAGVMGLAMEYVDGVSLEQRLSEGERLPLDETVAIGRALASALAAVHRAGLVHRDVKPANVLSTSESYKLIDFGVAAAGASPPSSGLPSLDLDDVKMSTGLRLSSFGSISFETPRGGKTTVALGVHCGTVGYMDPICITAGLPATPASDLYALGATLFHCLVGHVPAEAADNGREVSNAILRGVRRAPPLTKLVPSAPRPLAALVDELLGPEREERPISAEVVSERLEHVQWLLAGRRSSVAPSPPTKRVPAQTAVDVFDGVAVRALGNALLAVYAAHASLERTRFFHDQIDQLAQRIGGEVVCLVVIPSTSSMPDAEARLEHARRFSKHAVLRRFVTVPIGDEFWHEAVRGVTHGMSQAHGHGCLFACAGSIPQGVEMMLDARRGQVTDDHVARVISAVRKLCWQQNV